MGFADDVTEDIEDTHADWARTDVKHWNRTLTAVSLTGSTPTFNESYQMITGVMTLVKSSLEETIFGGMKAGEAVLMVLPDVDITYEDLIECDDVFYRIEEIRDEDVGGTVVQRYCRLGRIRP